MPSQPIVQNEFEHLKANIFVVIQWTNRAKQKQLQIQK